MTNNINDLIGSKLYNSSDEIFRNELLPKIQETNEKYVTFFSKELWDENEIIHNELIKVENDYKKGFNHFGYWMLAIFGLIISIILIIPAYWAIKKFKQMKNQRKELQSKLNRLKQKKIDFLLRAVLETDFTNYWNEMNSIKNYIDYGPLNEEQLKFFSSNNDISTENSNGYNSFNTTWGVLKNKLIINAAKKTHYMSTKTYTGSETVSYQEYVDGEYETRYTTVYASVTKPYPVFNFNKRCWVYTSSCRGLTLDLYRFDHKKRIKQDKNHIALENIDFESYFKWSYNDPIKLRMVFTPYTQEYYVNNAFYNNKFNSNYKLKIIDGFITNNWNISDENSEKSLVEVIQNYQSNLSDLDNAMKHWYSFDIENFYKETTPVWILPIIQSEDHTEVINKLKNAPKIPSISTFQYALNKMIKKNVVVGNTDTMHSVGKVDKFITSNFNEVFYAEMIGLTYDEYSRVEYVSQYCEAGCVDVPVYYYEYIQRKDRGNIYISYIDNKWSRNWDLDFVELRKNDQLNAELDEILKFYKEQDIYISIENSLIAVMTKKICNNEILNIFDKIIPIIKKYN